MSQPTIETRLANGDILILDGATGSQLERLGAPMHSGVWCAAAIESHPDLVRQVHQDYIAVGADIITTNTYASARAALAKSGLEDKFVAWNTKAVSLAHEARDHAAVEHPIYIAGSIAPYDNWRNYDVPTMRASYREQADLLAEGKVDFIVLEMLGADIENTIMAIEETVHTGLPIWVSLSCLDDPDSKEVYFGVRESPANADNGNKRRLAPFGTAIKQIMGAGGSVLSMMHSEVHIGVAALAVMKDHFSGPLGVYPNAGYWERPNWTFVDSVSPESYWQEAQKWVEMGAQIIGGCCGMGPEHIQALHDGLRKN